MKTLFSKLIALPSKLAWAYDKWLNAEPITRQHCSFCQKITSHTPTRGCVNCDWPLT